MPPLTTPPKNWANLFRELIGHNLVDLYERAQVDPQAALDDLPNILTALDYGLNHPPNWPHSRDLILYLSPYIPRREIGAEWETVLNRAIAYSHRTTDSAEIPLRLYLGIHLRLQGKLVEARNCIEQALTLCKTLADLTYEALLQVQLSMILCRQTQYKPALKIIEPLLQINDLDDQVCAEANNAKGLIYYEQRLCNQALQSLQKALAIYNKLGDPFKEAQVLVNRGATYRQLEDFEQAEESYRQAITNFQVGADRIDEHKAIMNLGNLYLKNEAYERAIEHYLQALPIFNQYHLSGDLSNVHNNLGMAYTAIKDWEAAETHFKKSLQLLKNSSDIRRLANILDNYGTMQIEAGQVAAARKTLTKALSILSSALDIPENARLYTFIKNRLDSLSPETIKVPND